MKSNLNQKHIVAESKISISGSGFVKNNTVFIGETQCQINNFNDTNIDCKPDNGPVGTYNISVYNVDKGLAIMNSTVTTYTFSLYIRFFSPAYCGTGGIIFIKSSILSLFLYYF